MSKRTTKADVILQGARERVQGAKERVRAAQENLSMLIAGLTAHEDNLAQLEKDLSTTPDKSKDKGKGRSSSNKNRGLPKDTEKTASQIGELAKPNGGDTNASTTE